MNKQKKYVLISSGIIAFLLLWMCAFTGGIGVGRLFNNPQQNKASETAMPVLTPSPALTPIQSSSPPTNNVKSPSEEEFILKGEQIYKRIESKYKLPVMFGFRAQAIKLLIPIKDWNELSKEDQINLAFYAQNLVGEINNNPRLYVERWIRYYKSVEKIERGMEYDGLTYDSYIEQASRVCSSCWDITLGTIKGKGFYDETIPVTGENIAIFLDSPKKVVEHEK